MTTKTNLTPRQRLAIENAMTRASEMPPIEHAERHFYKGDHFASILSVNR